MTGTLTSRTKHSLKYGGEENRELYSYLVSHSVREDPHLRALQERTMSLKRAGWCSPPDSIPVLQMLLRLTKAQKAIEVGVFTGFVSLGLAMALPDDGRLIACDITDEYASVGMPFWKAAGVDGKIDLCIGAASETLTSLLQDGHEGTFDFAFIDADKSGYDDYYEKLLRLVRPGGIIVVDNVLWSGRVIDPANEDKDTVAIRALNDKIYKDERVHMAMLSVSDGMTVAMKR